MFAGSAALSAKAVNPRTLPDIGNMSFVLKTKTKNISVPLTKPEELWANEDFNPELPLVMMITGWTTNINDSSNPTLDKIFAAYKCRGNVNFVVITIFLITLFHFIIGFFLVTQITNKAITNNCRQWIHHRM